MGADPDAPAVSPAPPISAIAGAARTLRAWSFEGPPRNPRAAAGALAGDLEACAVTFDALVAETLHLRDREASARELLDGALSEAEEVRRALERHRCAERRLMAKLAVGMAMQGAIHRLLVRDIAASEASRMELLAASRAEAESLSEALEAQGLELAKLRQQHSALCLQVRESIPPVSVMCRVRPLESYPAPAAAADKSCVAIEGQDLTVEDAGGRSRKFRVDRVLDGGMDQDDVFGVAAPWVESVLGGASACVVAYGATGSGKTYTIQGSQGQGPAHLPRVCGLAHHALRRLIDGPDGGRVRLSVVEVYCDQIRDLLAPPTDSNDPPSLQCSRRDMQGKMFLDAVQVEVDAFARAEEVLERGYAARATDATLCNEHSSRSHIVLTAQLLASGGQLVLVDLAGSENVHRSGADGGGQLLTEAKAINKSLSALADVVEALAKRQAFVPYRNSRLTMLLEDVLGPAKVLLLVHVSPLAADATVTGHSLQFAGRVRSVDFGAQMLRKDQEQRLKSEHQRSQEAVRRLELQLDALRKELTDAQKQRQEQKQQVSQLSEQLREVQRELVKEKELRAKLEASTRAPASAYSAANQPAPTPRGEPPPLRQPAPAPPAAAALPAAAAAPAPSPATATASASAQQRRRLPTPPILNRAPREGASPMAPTSAPPPLPAMTASTASLVGRLVFGDVTNRTKASDKPIHGDEIQSKEAVAAVVAGLSPPKLSFGLAAPAPLLPQAATSPNRLTFELRPTSQPQASPVGRVDSVLSQTQPQVAPRCENAENLGWSEHAIQISDVSQLADRRSASAELLPRSLFRCPTSDEVPLRGILKKVPTNFAARARRRRDGAGGGKTVTFAGQVAETASPPKWYLQFVADLRVELENSYRTTASNPDCAGKAADGGGTPLPSPRGLRSPASAQDEPQPREQPPPRTFSPSVPAAALRQRRGTPISRPEGPAAGGGAAGGAAAGLRKRPADADSDRPPTPHKAAWAAAQDSAPRWRA